MIEVIVGRDDEDTAKYRERGTLLIGKHIVGTGENAHLTTPVRMDAIRPHVMAITGKRGSGKSFSLGVISEELMKLEDEVKKNLCGLMIDTQGIFWTMKSPNEENISLLREWGLSGKSFNAEVLVPSGQSDIFEKSGIDYDGIFSVKANELTKFDWLSTLNLDVNESAGIILQRVFDNMSGEYNIDDIIENIRNIEGFEEEKLELENMMIGAKSWGIFGKGKTPKVLVPGKLTILDVSLTPINVRSLIVAILSRKILAERIKARREEEIAKIEEIKIKRTPMCWMMIDEAHNFVPAEGRPACFDIMSTIIKEGRQPGITLVLATQRPDKLHPDALAQCDIILSHRLTSKADLEALSSIMQTYMSYDIDKYIQELPHLKGTAIILDDNSERLYKIRVRPKQSWHAGSSPVAV